jgi:hypothetical protein
MTEPNAAHRPHQTTKSVPRLSRCSQAANFLPGPAPLSLFSLQDSGNHPLTKQARLFTLDSLHAHSGSFSVTVLSILERRQGAGFD